jgi:hypothetical protein
MAAAAESDEESTEEEPSPLIDFYTYMGFGIYDVPVEGIGNLRLDIYTTLQRDTHNYLKCFWLQNPQRLYISVEARIILNTDYVPTRVQLYIQNFGNEFFDITGPAVRVGESIAMAGGTKRHRRRGARSKRR